MIVCECDINRIRHSKSMRSFDFAQDDVYGEHFDSLREVEIGMKAEVNKLHHLGIDYVVRRSTLADANKRRPQEFFAKVYHR